MKSILPISTLIFSLSASPLFANNPTEEVKNSPPETGIGCSTGSVVGGLVAGPIGVVTGALIGSLIGQTISDKKNIILLSKSNDELNNELQATSNGFDILKKVNTGQSLAINDAQHTIEYLLSQNQELRNHVVNIDVQFRTNSFNIEKQYQKYLDDLANTLNFNPNLEIEVAGFSDRTGDVDYNMNLSNQRAIQVKDYLISHGIKEERITTLAFGENQPLHSDESLENNFFDRRVTVYLIPNEISTKNIANEIMDLEDSLSVSSKQK
jgi:sortase system peptidoglycan-associated protein